VVVEWFVRWKRAFPNEWPAAVGGVPPRYRSPDAARNGQIDLGAKQIMAAAK